MDISMNEIDSITLNCFTNNSHFNSIVKMNGLYNDKSLISDKKFYKKRILDLTKKMLKDDIKNEEIQLVNSFNNYIKSCINNFKFIDKTDIIQEKYQDLEDSNLDNSNLDNSNLDNSNLDNSNLDNSNLLLIKQNNVKQINLDSLVLKKNKKKLKIIPQKENINIKTKEYKIKGLKKKKNINSIYEEKNKKE